MSVPTITTRALEELERQVRIAAGARVLLGRALGAFGHPAFLGLSAFAGAGLLFAGATDALEPGRAGGGGMSSLIGQALLVAASTALDGGGRAASAFAFGAVVGLSLGLTGGGGSIFAVPLLVYGLAVRPREAVGVSLAAVGATALIGGLGRLGRGEVELRTGLMFAVAGMFGAPAGSWLGGRAPEAVLLALFAGLMAVVAVRMWIQAARRPEEARAVRATLGPPPADERGPACRRDPSGRLHLNSRCFGVLVAAGVVAGVLSGLFGVGGGFVIVPALVLVTGMGIHRAVATSLLVIALVSASGVASYLAAGRPLPLDLTGLFVLGGVGGMELGAVLGRRLGGPGLQKLFAAAMVAVAALIVAKSLI